jgi:hypothetical protein
MVPDISEAEWEKDCIMTYRRVLTGKKRHWCPEWDFLPIDETSPEFESCTCDLDEAPR